MQHDKILILDFGSQVTQLIARRVREAHVYCEVHPCDVTDAWVRDYAADGTLKGFANISLDLVGKPLPSRERTEQIARAFLQQTAPDLLPRMMISWIEPHDEPIRVQREGRTETVTLTGMKVKARNLADGRWFWVIVGSDQTPMVFERDIVWINFPGHRKTEKWLHDGWLKQQADVKQQVEAKSA